MNWFDIPQKLRFTKEKVSALKFLQSWNTHLEKSILNIGRAWEKYCKIFYEFMAIAGLKK